MTICLGKESPATLETLGKCGENRKIDPLRASSRPVYVMPQRDDGLPLFLSATVCLFGSWMGSDNGDT